MKRQLPCRARAMGYFRAHLAIVHGMICIALRQNYSARGRHAAARMHDQAPHERTITDQLLRMRQHVVCAGVGRPWVFMKGSRSTVTGLSIR